MKTFLLPYLIFGQPVARNFVQISAATIELAAEAAEKQLRDKYSKLLKKLVCVGVLHVDYTYRDHKTGKPIPQPAPFQQPNRRRRNYRRW